MAALAAAIVYGAASVAATQAIVVTSPIEARTARLQREIVRIVVTLTSASAGAMLESRRVAPAELLLFGIVFAGLSATVVSGTSESPRAAALSFAFGLVPAVLLVFASAVHGTWFGLLWGALAALPFALSGWLYPRPSSTDDAMYAGLVGLLLSLLPAMFVLFIACLCSLAVARRWNQPATMVRFSPYVAGFLMIGLAVQFAFAA